MAKYSWAMDTDDKRAATAASDDAVKEAEAGLSTKISFEQLLEMRANMLREEKKNTNDIMRNKEIQNDSQHDEQSRTPLGPKLNNSDLRMPQLDVSEAEKTLKDLTLTSVKVGDYLIVMNHTFDVTLNEEPYLALTVFYNTISGKFLKRIWNKTVASGKVVELSEFMDVCSAHLKQGRPCLGYLKYERKSSSTCNIFVTQNSPREIEMCKECLKARDTKTNGKEHVEKMRKDEKVIGKIKTEDFVEADGESKDLPAPSEESQWEDDVTSEVPLAGADSMIDHFLYPTCELEEFGSSSARRQDAGEEVPKRVKKILRNLRGSQYKGTHWRLSEALAVGEVEAVGTDSFKCQFCDEVFPAVRHKYAYHLKYKHCAGKFFCIKCEFKGRFAKDLVDHIEQAGHEDHFIQCPSCREYVDKFEIENHYKLCLRSKDTKRCKKNDSTNVSCETCGKIFKSKKVYKNHLLIHIRAKGESVVKVPGAKKDLTRSLYVYCDKCDKKFILGGAGYHYLKLHMQAEHGDGF